MYMYMCKTVIDNKVMKLLICNALQFYYYLITVYQVFCGRCGGLMVCALYPELSSLGSSPGQSHGVVFLGKTLKL